MNTLKKSIVATFKPQNIYKELVEIPRNAKLILIGLLFLNTIIFLYSGDKTYLSYIGLGANLVTIINVILLDFGKITKSFWGVISLLLSFIIAIKINAIGDQYVYIFSFIMQFVGSYIWVMDMDSENQVIPKKLNFKIALLSIFSIIVLYLIVLKISLINDGAQPYLISMTLPINIVSNFLMVFRYKEQWYGWILMNLINVVVWINFYLSNTDGSVIVLALQVMLLINALYGFINWRKIYKRDNKKTI